MNAGQEIRDHLRRRRILSARDAEQTSIAVAIGEVDRNRARLSRRYIVSQAGSPLFNVQFVPRPWGFQPADIVETRQCYAKLQAFEVPQLLDHFSTRAGHFFVEQHLPAAVPLARLVEAGELNAGEAAQVLTRILGAIWESGTAPSPQFIRSEQAMYREYFCAFVQSGVLGRILVDYVNTEIEAVGAQLRRVNSTGDITDRNILRSGGLWYLVDFEYCHPTLFFFKEWYRTLLYSPWAAGIPLRQLCPFLPDIPEDVARLVALAWEGRLCAELLDVRGRAHMQHELRQRFWNVVEPSLAARLDQQLNAVTGLLQAREADLCDLRNASANQRSEMTAVLGKLEARDSQLGELRQGIDSREAELARLRSAVEGQGRDLAEVQAAVDARDLELASLRSAVEARAGDLAEVQASVEARDVELASLHAALAARQSQIDDLHRAIQEREAAVHDQRREAHRLRQELDARQQQLDRIHRSIYWRVGISVRWVLLAALGVAASVASFLAWVAKYTGRRVASAFLGVLRALALCGRLLARAALVIMLYPLCILLWVALPVRRRPLAKQAPIAPQQDAVEQRLATVIVLNWNGEDLLRRCVPSVIRAVEKSGKPHEILVVDNGSTDGSVPMIEREYGRVGLLQLDKNYGFGEGNNRGVCAARHEYVVCLNNDMVVDEDFLEPLLSRFVDPGVFAVTSQIRFQDPRKRQEETGRTYGWFDRGQIRFSHGPLLNLAEPPQEWPVLWAGGGSSAFNKQRFLDLGGFAPAYSPAYVEDTDLSYRAWKRGWRCVLAPESVVHHEHRASSRRRFRPRQLDALILRNRWLFHFRNLTDSTLFSRVLLWFPINAAAETRAIGVLPVLGALMQVAAALPGVWRARRSEIRQQRVADLDIISLNRQVLLPATRRSDRLRILFVSAHLPMEGIHGGGQRVFKVMHGLAQSHSISLLSFYEDDEERGALPALEDFCAALSVIRRGQSPAASNPCGIKVPGIVYEYMNGDMRQAILAAAHSGAYDILQFEWLEVADLVPRYSTVKKILTHLEVQFAAQKRLVATGAARGPRAWFSRMRMLNYELGLLDRFDLILTVTDQDAKEILSYRPELPIAVHNTGVDIQRLYPPDTPAASQIVTFVGYFKHAPNVDAMLYFCEQIWPLISHAEPAARLRIVGSHPPDAILHLRRLHNVEVTGWVPSLLPYYHESRVVIAPMRHGVGIRGKILEAWAARLAVVSTSLGCAGLRCESGRHLRVADEPSAFAAAVVELLRNQELCHALGSEGYNLAVRLYDWRAKIAQHGKLYQHLLRGSLADVPKIDCGA